MMDWAHARLTSDMALFIVEPCHLVAWCFLLVLCVVLLAYSHVVVLVSLMIVD